MQAIVVADNQEDRDFLNFVLRHAGVAVATTAALQPVTATLAERPVDLVLLSLPESGRLLPDIEALRLVTQVPVVALMGMLTEELHCALLDAGVDLVLPRPFSARVLSRYVRILLRRSRTVPASVLPRFETDTILLDPTTRTVTVSGCDPQRLTQLEFRLFYLLVSNQNQVLPADMIVERVWGYSGQGNRELVRGLIRRLRRKIETPSASQRFIQNIPGVGYRFSTDAPADS
ncbi:MAG: response regulator transcription factor [Anaerolineales bacterium]|nr:response regulator transcription factor [Anaerolineales bacterium]MCB8952804.1 response regulator transcription factor [Ardenticatenales bacterium]